MVALQLYGYKQVAVSPCGYVVGKIHSQIKPVFVSIMRNFVVSRP